MLVFEQLFTFLKRAVPLCQTSLEGPLVDGNLLAGLLICKQTKNVPRGLKNYFCILHPDFECQAVLINITCVPD
jgi:hypothetical protein